jgi:predicted RNA-binding protein with PUA-like domain
MPAAKKPKQYWLVKSEPVKYSWDEFVKDGWTYWDGVRNYQARNNLKAMSKGDGVLYYHSNEGTEVVGIAKVIKEAYQDPTTEDERWVVVDLKPVKALKKPVTLADVKADERLANMALVRQSRLSVMPVAEDEFDVIVTRGKGKIQSPERK